MWHHGSTFVQTVDAFWSYRVTVSERVAAGLLLWLTLLSGTLSRTISGIQVMDHRQLQALTENVFVFSAPVQFSALDVLRRYALQIYILLTYLLINCRWWLQLLFDRATTLLRYGLPVLGRCAAA